MSLPHQTGPRLEHKRVVPPTRVEELLGRLGARMSPDPHASDPEDPIIHVASLYFDSEDRVCYRNRSREQLPKHRLRRYDACSGFFMEEKLRLDNRVWKRRIPVAVEDLEAVIKGTQPLDGETEWFRSRFRALGLVPSLMIEYRRRAYVAPCGGRVTVDDQIRARRVAREFHGFDAESKQWMITDDAILELKGPVEPSPLMQKVARGIQLSTDGFSKYCFGLEAAGLEFRNGNLGASP